MVQTVQPKHNFLSHIQAISLVESKIFFPSQIFYSICHTVYSIFYKGYYILWKTLLSFPVFTGAMNLPWFHTPHLQNMHDDNFSKFPHKLNTQEKWMRTFKLIMLCVNPEVYDREISPDTLSTSYLNIGSAVYLVLKGQRGIIQYRWTISIFNNKLL